MAGVAADSPPAFWQRGLESLAAATISAFTGDVASFAIIAIVIVLSVTFDFVQE